MKVSNLKMLHLINHTLALMDMHYTTSLQQLTPKLHVKISHPQSVLRSSDSTYFLKRQNNLNCHSKHPPMSRSCTKKKKKLPHLENLR